MDIIKRLENCNFGREICHADGFGHVQVEIEPPSCYLETPAYLLELVEEQGLWPEFFALAKTRDNGWIQRICKYLYFTDSCATQCFVRFLDMLSGREPQLQLLQDSPLWHWDANNVSLIETVIAKATQLSESTPPDDPGSDIDLLILQSLIGRLEALRAQIKGIKP
jgi:hypothetical protein